MTSPKKQHMSAILLSGGSGNRMNQSTPKQYLKLNGKEMIKYSFELFLSLEEITEIVVVCAPEFQSLFLSFSTTKNILFALPGKTRQQSVFNGLKASTSSIPFACIHDGARPFISKDLTLRTFKASCEHKAAAPGVPLSFTIKEINSDNLVNKTLDRSTIQEIQTPQIIEKNLLNMAYLYAQEHNLSVTDDVSLVELMNQKVKIVEGDKKNIKVTTPTDLLLCDAFMSTPS